MKIGINYLSYNRMYASRIIFSLIRSVFLDKDFIFRVFAEAKDIDFWKNIKDTLEKENCGTIDIVSECNTYLEKIKKAASYDDDISIKLDEDCILTGNFFQTIKNDFYKKRKDALILMPTISNGIPSVEMFIEDYLSDPEKDMMFKHFASTKFYNRDGEAYEALNGFMCREQWDADHFYQLVKSHISKYQGIHPIRISNFLNVAYNNIILSKIESILFRTRSTSFTYKKQYVCNSVFAIETKIWNKIINDKSLYVDGFDEYPLNKYISNEDMCVGIIRNCPCIHMYYNWFPSYSIHERHFIDKLERILGYK